MGKAEMSQPMFADFAAFAGQVDGEYVRRPIPVLFRAGKYDFPKTDTSEAWSFEMTPDDIKTLIAGSKDAAFDVDDAHRPTVKPDGSPAPKSFFEGKLGKIVNLRPLAENDYSGLAGEWLCPRPINALSPDKPISMSATFDPTTKKLKKVSLTDHPRIADAGALPAEAVNLSADAIFSALSAAEASKDAEFATEGQMRHTPHGLSAMQMHHDMAAHAGALCDDGMSKGGAEMAEFTLPFEREAIQKIHDAAKAGGAECRLCKHNENDGAHTSLAHARDAYYAEFAEAAMTPTQREYNRRLKARQAELDAREKGTQEATFAANAKAAETRAADAALALIKAKKAVRGSFAGLRDEYLQACMDDLRHPGEVQFSLDGRSFQKGTREDAVKARWRAAPQLAIYGEQVAAEDIDKEALFSLKDRETADPQKPRESVVQAALKGAGHIGAAALEERAKRNGTKKK